MRGLDVAFAQALQIAYSPPFWVHLITSLPFMLVTCLLPLRPLTGVLVASQYHHKAGEGRLVGLWYPYGPDKPGVSQPPPPW